MKLKKMFRAIAADSVDLDTEKRTITFPFSSELPVERWFGNEILSHEKGAADLSRLNDGGALLWNHDTDEMIGCVESAELRGKRGYATVRFANTDRANEVLGMIQDGILKNVSFGYQLQEMELTKSEKGQPDTYTATKWMPFEVSFVSVPADPTVGVGRSDANEELEVKITDKQQIDSKGVIKMDPKEIEVLENKAREEAQKQERERSSAIVALGEKHKMQDLARDFVNNGKPVDEFRAAVLEKMGTQKPITGTEADIGLTEKEVRDFSFMRAINALAEPNNFRAQEAAKFEREVSDAAAKKMGKTARGIYVPYEILRAKRDLTKGTPADGGYTVGTETLGSSFIELLRKKSALDRAGATVLNGLVGDIAIPKQSGAATAYWVAENSAPTESKQAFGQVAMSPKTVAAYTDISRKLRLQSSIDIEALVKADLARVLALALDYAGLYGSGSSNQPQGLAGGSFVTGLNTKDLASAGDPTYAEVVDMESLIAADDADVANMKYILSATMRGKMKSKVKFSSTDSLTVWEQGGTVNGYDAIVSNQVAAADLFFGNWNDLLIGLWSGIDLLVDPYTGSNAGTVRVTVFQDADIAARHGESFCYANDSIS